MTILNEALVEIIIDLHQRSLDDVIKETVRKLHNYYYHSQQLHHHKRRHHLDQFHRRLITTEELESNQNNVNLLKSITDEKIPLPKPKIYPLITQDFMQCYTDYEPRSMREASLKALVIAGLADKSSSSTKGWKFNIYENLIDNSLVQNHFSNGFIDFKYTLFGNRDDGPISFFIQPNRPGPVSFFCHIVGILHL